MLRNPSAVAPYFSRALVAWVPYALTWDPETSAIRGAEGPGGFDTYREAVEASRFLVGGPRASECGELPG